MWQTALMLYKLMGREAARRFLTPPRKFVEAACAKTGADVAKAIEERDEAVNETLEFLESIADAGFVDED